jgi:hypothetical protein
MAGEKAHGGDVSPCQPTTWEIRPETGPPISFRAPEKRNPIIADI